MCKELPKCKVSKCEKDSYYGCRGWCKKHYLRNYRHGSTEVVLDRWGNRKGKHPDSYAKIHKALRNEKGSPSEYKCQCGKQAKDWALLWHKADEVILGRLGRNPLYYSTCLDMYEPKCRRCHIRYDRSKDSQ